MCWGPLTGLGQARPKLRRDRCTGVRKVLRHRSGVGFPRACSKSTCRRCCDGYEVGEQFLSMSLSSRRAFQEGFSMLPSGCRIHIMSSIRSDPPIVRLDPEGMSLAVFNIHTGVVLSRSCQKRLVDRGSPLFAAVFRRPLRRPRLRCCHRHRCDVIVASVVAVVFDILFVVFVVTAISSDNKVVFWTRPSDILALSSEFFCVSSTISHSKIRNWAGGRSTCGSKFPQIGLLGNLLPGPGFAILRTGRNWSNSQWSNFYRFGGVVGSWL